MSSIIGPILALDTHGFDTGIALYRDGAINHFSGSFGRDLDVHLPVFVEDSLGREGWRFQDIQGFLVVVGPGGFAGLRIGLSYVRGLALGLDVPVWGVSSLEAKIGGGLLPKYAHLPARRRAPDKSWWVQRFGDKDNSEIKELDEVSMKALAVETEQVFNPEADDHGNIGGAFAVNTIEWWQKGRPVRAGAEAAFVRSALR